MIRPTLAILAFLALGAASREIPTGQTPDLFPGSVGWRPSGTGIAIPDPAIVDGVPRGLWWKVQSGPGGGMKPVVHFYLDGVRASNPRLGGGRLFDREGQSKARGSTGLGTFVIAKGQIVEAYDGFENKGAFTTGKDADGPFFKIGGATFRPLVALTPKTILGKWRGPSETYEFHADGTFTGALSSGTWILDGYLLMIVPKDGEPYISVAGMTGLMLAKGSTFYTRME